ncbi:SusC/RagA family TonB-linked outer membrane protein [Flavisolibacter tropicus]|uniref:Membrane protein n=1 Tax=Flavisolibacter tropicus TaxID=1492898 RepID=A0A172TQF5_9BACT|nr:SusC/RagA family TonB-linked outer membrane protein [Flavisolibacter tropicus]ANE49301.1 membrane protein [Flavisolibacter tropicus]
MKRFTLAVFMLMLFHALVIAQTITVTGKITTGNGEAVPFATVTVAGSTTAVQADANGNFTISARQGAQLVASATGFQPQTITVNGNTANFNIQRGTGQLQEVVVTAFGQRRSRNQVPYAAQQVTGDDVSKNRSSNFMQNLSGRVSGLEMRQSNTLGGSTNVVLRGTKTMISSNQALFVIDGVPINNSNQKSIDPVTGVAQQSVGRGGYDYGSNAADVNPDDIESITVLKGAAATALYGSRGGNGVILITTKKGVRGVGVTVNSSIGIGKYDKSTFPTYQHSYGAGYGPFYGPNQDAYFDKRDINGDGVDDLVAPFYEDASYGAPFDPSLLVYQWHAFDPNSPNYGKATPWVAAANDPSTFLETAISSNQSIMVDGANDKGSFKLGYTRTDDKGILPNSLVTKNIVNFGSVYSIVPKLTVGGNINYTNTNGKGRYGTGYDDKNVMTNFRQWWEMNVDIKEQKDAYFANHENITWNWTDADILTPIYWDNPYFSRYENYETDTRDRYFGNINVTYKPLDWLSILGRVSRDAFDELQEERQAVGSVTTSSYVKRNRKVNETNYDLIANFDRDLNTDINFKGLIGTNVRRERSQFILSSTNNGLIIPKVYALSNTTNPITAPIESDARRQVWGNFAGVTFTWRDMVTLDATIRNDQSSTLPKGNNSYWYPSVSGGFTFSRLLSNFDWLSYGKVRANYAEVGNDTDPYATTETYQIGSPFGSNPLVSVTGINANPNLLPEKTKSYEFGLEASFFKNRLGFDATYYNAKTFNQIYPVPLSTSIGYNSRWFNSGDVRNKGWEVTMFGTPIQKHDFSWNINLNWTRNRNKVESLYTDPNDPSIKIDNVVLVPNFQGGVTLNATLGQPYGTIRGTDFIYHENGQPIINQSNGRPMRTTSSNIVIGNINPDWVGGINNALRYKNASLSFLIDMRQGGDVYSLDRYYGLATGLYPESAGLNDLGNPSRLPLSQGGGVILPGVAPDGKPNTVRADNNQFGLYGYRRQPNKAFVYNASFVKLREVVLGYSLPKSVMSKLNPFKSIDFSLIGRNLWIIHKDLPYADPEENISAGNFQGLQSGAYPSVKTYTFNLRFRF